MSYNNFQFFKFRIERGVMFVTIDHIEGIMEESRLFSTILASAKKRMKKFLESDGQIHPMELDWTNMWDVLAKVE